MRLGLYGGSFDPIHRGHVDPIREAIEAVGLDRVVYLPTARPPHKGERSAPAHRRFAMVELALLELEEHWVSEFEMTPGRKAYTVDSIRHFSRVYENAEIFLLLGGDNFLQFTTWREWQEIADRATLVVLSRPGSQADAGHALSDELRALVENGRVRFVKNRPMPFASRELRATLANGAALPDGALSPLVLDYLRKYDLYR